MFRLLRSGSSSLERYWPLSFSSLSANNQSNSTEKTCLLCKRLNITAKVQFRQQSSLIKPRVKIKKKKKNKVKTYAEIIEITQDSSHLRKANITKLTSADVDLLATTNIGLNELYKLKKTNKSAFKYLPQTEPQTYSNLAVEGSVTYYSSETIPLKSKTNIDFKIEPPIISMAPSMAIPLEHESEDIHEEEQPEVGEESLENEIDLKILGPRASLQPEVVEENVIPDDSKKEKPQISPERAHYVQQLRDVIASNTLAAYVEVCNHLRNPQRGLQALHFHQYRSRRDPGRRLSRMKNLNVYYHLLKGFANKGDLAKLEQVLKIMEEENIAPDLNCYVAILECLGRTNIQNHYLKLIRIHVKNALQKGITVDDMVNKGIFLNDERDHFLKAIRAYDPKYEPKYQTPNVWYDNHLLNHLNHDCQLTGYTPEKSTNKKPFIGESFILDRLHQQVSMEEKGYVTIKSIENTAKATKEVKLFRSALEDHYKMWYEAAQNAFYRDLATLAAKRNPLNIEPYLRSVPVKDIIEIIVQEAKKIAQGSETYSPEVSILYKQLGAKLYARYRTVRKQKTGVLDKTLQIHSQYCKDYASSHLELDVLPSEEVFFNPRVHWQWLEHKYCSSGATLDMAHQPWVPTATTSVGKFLYHIIMHDLKIDVNSLRPSSKHKNLLPAFYTIFRSQGRIVKEEIKPHPVLSKLYKLSQPETLTFAANEVPMICPPIPWTSLTNGGYTILPTDVVRLPFLAAAQKKRMAEADPRQLYPNFDALNQLSAIPWKVNLKILDVTLKVFRDGGSSKLDVPEHPSKLPPPTPITAEMDKNEKYQLFKEKLQHRRKKAEMYSLWCDCLYRLSLANHFRNDVFWLPHNMDFRGRVYPVPPHLNHLGSDLARSMLVFAEGRPLGPEGFDWLKIHLINLTGLKKRDSIQDRLKYANEIMGLILDSADNPLDGRRWWAESDEPWQTLACCMEIADVVRSGKDPALYKSHFPVHQDGSCNGLQHYAALGRDSAGAFSVNLSTSSIPQDVYSAVVTLVEEQRAKDELAGIEIAKVLNGFIKRKVIKQTIMTTVYGVTRYGARLQIAKQLKDIDDFPKEAVWAASSYLTGRTFDSLRTMFTSTREIQDWFTECARLISGTGANLVEWVTPLGLPVVQPYIKYKKAASMPCGYESFLIDQFEKPNMMKQKNAFPPNFIHSLDSSHMMLTSLHCERAGITFVSVHDCYWTHPSTIHIMNKICREQFVALHSEPILENLSIFLYDLFSYDDCDLLENSTSSEVNKRKLNRLLKQLPKKGDFDIKNVLDSVYFFS